MGRRRPPCPSGKHRYRDEVAARLALAEVLRKDRRWGRERSAYRCPQCRGFHLTSQPPKPNKPEGTR